MNSKLRKLENTIGQEALTQSLTRIGSLDAVDVNGNGLVDWSENPAGESVKALSLIKVNASQLPLPVLLGFPCDEASAPVILGQLYSDIRESLPVLTGDFNRQAKVTEAIIDGKRIVLNGQQEVVLISGKSSITLRRDGKIIIKGVDVVSRAARANKIRGAAVNIN